MLLLLLSFIQFFSAPSDTLLNQSYSQAEYYIQEIEDGKQIEENLWALTVLTQANSQVKTFVEQNVQESPYSNNRLDSFRQIEASFNSQLEKVTLNSGSSLLLLALLLSVEEPEDRQKLKRQFDQNFKSSSAQKSTYDKVLETVINEGKIGSDVISPNQFTLSHFFLLFYNDHINLSESYLKDLSNNLRTNTSKNNMWSLLSHVTKFRAHYLLDEYGEINSLYNALTTKNLFPNSSLKLSIYRYLDYSMYRLGRYDRSLRIVRNYTLPLAKYLKEESTYLQTKQLQAVYLYSIGKIGVSENIFEEVLNSVNKSDPQLRLSSLYNNLALTKYKLGKYNEYLDLQFQALKNAEKINNYSHQIEIYNNLFIYYRKTNNQDNAITYLDKALKLAQEQDRISDLGTINMLAGSFYRKFEKNYKKAHRYFNEAETILSPKNNKQQYLELLNEQAETYEEQKRYEQALNS